MVCRLSAAAKAAALLMVPWAAYGQDLVAPSNRPYANNSCVNAPILPKDTTTTEQVFVAQSLRVDISVGGVCLGVVYMIDAPKSGLPYAVLYPPCSDSGGPYWRLDSRRYPALVLALRAINASHC
jgi:hypothetical protein